MFNEYYHQFSDRFQNYRKAMDKFPEFRRAEFNLALPYLSGRVLDICSGSKNLYNYAGEVESYDPVFMGSKGLPAQSFDTAVCLAAFHHIENGQELALFTHRVLKPGGKLIILDPWKFSSEAADLDRMIPNHHGKWLSAERLEEFSPWFSLHEKTVNISVNWGQGMPAELTEFCTTLFSVPERVFKRHMGYRIVGQAFVWKLSCVVLTRESLDQ